MFIKTSNFSPENKQFSEFYECIYVEFYWNQAVGGNNKNKFSCGYFYFYSDFGKSLFGITFHWKIKKKSGHNKSILFNFCVCVSVCVCFYKYF